MYVYIGYLQRADRTIIYNMAFIVFPFCYFTKFRRKKIKERL